MIPRYHIAPLDKTRIKTRLAIHPRLREDPVAYLRDSNLQIRSARPTQGRSPTGTTWNLVLDILTYGGVSITLRHVPGDPLVDATIEFNPGKCLYGHNARILSPDEFLDALTLKVMHLRPLLDNKDDWIHLIPGLQPGGRAYWSYLEVFLHCHDPEGALLDRLRHVRHPSIRKVARHWPSSIEVGRKKGKLQLSIYRKAVEMANRKIGGEPLLSEEELAEYSDILRLEARMRNEKLVLYFGNGSNTEVIDGKERLVWFHPRDLVRGHRACLSELQGVYSPSPGDVTELTGECTPLEAYGRTLAQVAEDERTSHTLPQLLDSLRHYTGASSDTMSKIRKAALAELSRQSGISRDAFLSDSAYMSQPVIVCGKAEKKVRHPYFDTDVRRLIAEVYCPPDQPFIPQSKLPGYLR